MILVWHEELPVLHHISGLHADCDGELESALKLSHPHTFESSKHAVNTILLYEGLSSANANYLDFYFQMCFLSLEIEFL